MGKKTSTDGTNMKEDAKLTYHFIPIGNHKEDILIGEIIKNEYGKMEHRMKVYCDNCGRYY